MLAILFRSVGYLTPKHLYFFGLSNLLVTRKSLEKGIVQFKYSLVFIKPLDCGFIKRISKLALTNA